MWPLLLLPLAAPQTPLFQARELTVGDAVVTTTCGSPAKDYILEVNGGGLLAEDFDGDGHLDLVVVNGSTIARAQAGEPSLDSRLLLGDGEGFFRDAGPRWSLAGGTWGMGGAVGDVNEDGWPDLFLTEWGENRLFLNDGGRGFVDVTAGLPGEGDVRRPTGLAGDRWSTSAAFLDYDGDGHLDLVVVNYLAFHLGELRGPGDGCQWKGHDVMCGPEGMVPVHDQLFRGRGDGTFEDVSVAAGFRPEQACFGLGVMTLDYDADGDTDVYVTNDSMPNHLWENQGDGTFVEVGLRRGVSHDSNGKEQAGMGIGCADVDGDGRADLFVTNFSGERNALYRSSRKTGFRERSDASRLGGPSIQRLGWGTALADLDLDGDVDAFVANGHVYPQADLAGTDTSYAQQDQLFRGDGTGRFDEEPLSQLGPNVTRAAVAADFDEDGDLDVVMIQLDGPVLYLENRAPHDDAHRWLAVRLIGRAGGNRFGLGARVTLELEGGGTRTGEVRGTAGYQAGQPARVHFGLGAAVPRAVVVRWPSGVEQRVEVDGVDRTLVVEAPPR
ncbi:MAG: CRTAC1 family protein [Planctomycetes bacterium]|nr:CRTAC1 family protein [Planctomycetota bacterium]